MTTNIRKKLSIFLAVAFWVILWEVISRTINLSFIIPTATETFACFFKLFGQKIFYKSILFSLLRVICGFALGLIIGFCLGFISHISNAVKVLFTPVILIIKSTPVASFIMILWFILSENTIPIAIGLLMVLPIIWQSTVNGLDSVNNELKEIAITFNFSKRRKFKHVYFPALSSFLLPAIITSSGLAWKAGIAAEIITYTKDSIGREISNAKSSFEGAQLFAWTMAVVLLSLLIETVINCTLRRLKRNEH